MNLDAARAARLIPWLRANLSDADADFVAALIAEVERLRAQNENWDPDSLIYEHDKAQAEAKRLRTVIGERLRAALDDEREISQALAVKAERLRAALDFYADPENWMEDGFPDSLGPAAVRDQGDRARDALGGGS